MSLIDGLIEDELFASGFLEGTGANREPAPKYYEVWICDRTDVPANWPIASLYGNGTFENPYAGRPYQRLDQTLRELFLKEMPLHIRFGPGVFQTRGGGGGNNPDIWWQLGSGWKISGAGIFQTTLQLVSAQKLMKKTLLLLFLIGAWTKSAADEAVFPFGYETNPGEAFPAQDPFPLDGRFQQVYEASEFSKITSTPVLISGIAFRKDEENFTGVTANPEFEVRLSTTAKGATSLSMTFSANIGPDETVVFPRAPYTFRTTPGQRPLQPFEIVIPFSNEFFYNPESGNLLLEIRSYAGGQRVSRLDWSTTGMAYIAGGIGVDFAAETDLRGLVSKFTCAPVPELKVTWIFIFGLCLLVGSLERKKTCLF